MNLKKQKSPKLFVEAFKFIGLKEIVGPEHNPIIMNWAKELNLEKIYISDEVPWCGLFIAKVCKDAGKEVVENPLWARNWLKWGTKQDVAMFGDILVFSRGKGGHVGIYVGEDKKCFHVLGGNQGNEVSVIRINKSRLLGIRRTPWKIAQPDNVKRVFLTEKGKLSENEQ